MSLRVFVRLYALCVCVYVCILCVPCVCVRVHSFSSSSASRVAGGGGGSAVETENRRREHNNAILLFSAPTPRVRVGTYVMCKSNFGPVHIRVYYMCFARYNRGGRLRFSHNIVAVLFSIVPTHQSHLVMKRNFIRPTAECRIILVFIRCKIKLSDCNSSSSSLY